MRAGSAYDEMGEGRGEIGREGIGVGRWEWGEGKGERGWERGMKWSRGPCFHIRAEQELLNTFQWTLDRGMVRFPRLGMHSGFLCNEQPTQNWSGQLEFDR